MHHRAFPTHDDYNHEVSLRKVAILFGGRQGHVQLDFSWEVGNHFLSKLLQVCHRRGFRLQVGVAKHIIPSQVWIAKKARLPSAWHRSEEILLLHRHQVLHDSRWIVASRQILQPVDADGPQADPQQIKAQQKVPQHPSLRPQRDVQQVGNRPVRLNILNHQPAQLPHQVKVWFWPEP